MTRAITFASLAGVIFAIAGFVYHDFVFPEIPDHAAKPAIIYTLPPQTALPGYVGVPSGSGPAIVFVHGLRDTGADCWASENGQYWPALVSHEAKGWDVYVEDYQDRISIEDIAAKMLVDLKDVFKDHSQIVFVAHSMGGLVVREFLIQNQQYAKKVPAIYLLATPSLGSKLADLASSIGLGTIQVDEIRSVKTNNFLRELNKRWEPFRRTVITECAFESRKTWLFNVVDFESANGMCNDRAVPINAGHSSIAKPMGPESLQNKKLMQLLADSPSPAVVAPGTSLELSFKFVGPFRVERNGDALAFNLTDAVLNTALSNQKIKIETASVTAQVSKESDEPFGFDQELLISSERLPASPAVVAGADYQQFLQLRGSYAPLRRVYQLTLRNDDGRSVHSPSPLIWSIDLTSSRPNVGELKAVRDSSLDVGEQGLPVQLFLWTLWGGQHFIEFSEVEVKLKVRVASPCQ
jgi:predicted alpha/beta hydrolase family esterase